MTVKVLYILGTQRGGSTIVGRLAGALPGFTYGGEMRRLWQSADDPNVRCGCGASHATCPVWAVVLPRVLAGGDKMQARAWQRAEAPDRRYGWRLLRDAASGPRRNSGAEYAALMGRTYREFAAVSDARVVVDGSKAPADAVLAAKSGVDVYILHLVRDPRGVGYSLARRTGESGVHPSQMVKASALWSARNVAGWLLRRIVGRARFMVLRYEDVIADPDAALARIAAFVGEEPRAVVDTDANILLPTSHTPTGNGGFVEKRVALALDDAWVRSSSAPDRVLVSVLTAPLLWRFGYRARRAKSRR
jgi:hypothetical protein